VEAVLQDLAGGKQCFVVGVPDEARGQIVVAIIVDGQGSSAAEESLKQRAGERLSNYKVPRRILWFARAAIPMLSSGKVDVRELTRAAERRCKACAAR
jgi:acyl-coenzyme A synthetase/AMP-(fatty) acid ligase